MVLLDTDVLIDFQRNFPPAAKWFLSLTEIPSVPGLVVMELIQVSHRLGLIDAFITAMAMKRQAQLCTFNIKHYRNIPGLNWQIPYAKK